MKHPLHLLLLSGFASSILAGSLDVEGLGRDVNGWADGAGRFSAAGTVFEAGRPTTAPGPGGSLSVAMPLKESERGSAVYAAAIEMTVDSRGAVSTMRISGELEGKPFDTGTVTRPDPPAALEGSAGEAAAPATIESPPPGQMMREELAGRLGSALAEAREADKVVKRDVSSWLFRSSASADASLVEGTMAVVRALFRRAGA